MAMLVSLVRVRTFSISPALSVPTKDVPLTEEGVSVTSPPDGDGLVVEVSVGVTVEVTVGVTVGVTVDVIVGETLAASETQIRRFLHKSAMSNVMDCA